MKQIFKKISLLAALISAAALHGALPADSIIVEAESFTVKSKNSWQVKPHFPRWYGSYPSGKNFLAAPLAKSGSAVKSVKIAAPGKHRLFVRYLDLLDNPASFVLTVSQKGKVLVSKEFDKTSLRKTPAGVKKHGGGQVRFVWQSVEFNAAAGEVKLELKVGSVNKGAEHGSRHVDVLLLTKDLRYKPDIKDFYPLYIKFRMLPEHSKASVIHMFMRRASAPHFLHGNFDKAGFAKGTAPRSAKQFIAPGESTPWVKFDDIMKFGGYNRMQFYAMTRYRGTDIKNAAFEVLFSRIPDDKGIFHRLVRKGNGRGMMVSINLATEEILDGDSESRKLLEYARNAGEYEGAPTLDFPFFTSGFYVHNLFTDETRDNLQKALRLVGINGSFAALDPMPADMPHGMTHAAIMGMVHGRCRRRPNQAKIDAYMKDVVKKVRHYKMPLINCADEPNMRVPYILKCKHCQAGFADYLKRNNAGVTGKMTTDYKAGLLYYWTMRYRSEVFTTIMKAGTDAVKKYHPGAVTTVNFGIEGLTTGVTAMKGLDWFTIFDTGALTFGWHEDWANLTGSYQINGYINDVMRAACRKRDIPFGVFNILSGRSQWDIQAKGFNAIGHGNKAMGFFNFGPHFSTTSDTNSDREEIYGAIKCVTYATGPVGKYLMAGKVAKGDVAMLQGFTNDIWHSPGTNKTRWQMDNAIGKERVFLHLLLRHCGYRIDIINEDGLEDELKNYKVLFVTDSHLHSSRVPALLRWVENGGTLFLTANALMYNEANKPLNFPVKREAFVFKQDSGRGEFNMPNLKTIAKSGKLALKCAYQKPFNQNIRRGKGRIIACGFLPGISYHSTAVKQDQPVPEGWKKNLVREYKKCYRDYIMNLKLPVKPRLTSSVYNVEANLIESPEADIIVLANFSGVPKKVTVTLDGKKYVRNIKAGGYIKVAK